MAPRANWKGYLRLSLVSCPIALYPASSLSEKVPIQDRVMRSLAYEGSARSTRFKLLTINL